MDFSRAFRWLILDWRTADADALSGRATETQRCECSSDGMYAYLVFMATKVHADRLARQIRTRPRIPFHFLLSYLSKPRRNRVYCLRVYWRSGTHTTDEAEPKKNHLIRKYLLALRMPFTISAETNAFGLWNENEWNALRFVFTVQRTLQLLFAHCTKHSEYSENIVVESCCSHSRAERLNHPVSECRRFVVSPISFETPSYALHVVFASGGNNDQINLLAATY